jgi:3-hydroxyisobutyrate dehydrogenase-like beta-hydroxyacid dehydrogenase
MRIAFIGFGEAGRAFRESLAATDASLSFAAYDILLDRQGTGGPCGQAMLACGVEIALSAGQAVSKADWVFSAVTADQSLQAAESVSPHLRAGQVLFDINSVSPQRKRDSADLLRATGASYVDMAVMAPVHPRGHRTPVLVAGSVEKAVMDGLGNLGFAFEVVGPQAGAATAIKMVRSLFVKGLEAITVETLLAAEASGCLDYILKSLSGSYPGLGFPGFAEYQFERTTRHGKRRAAEMRESAGTLDDLRLHGKLAEAIADVQERMGGLQPAATGQQDLHSTAERLLALRRG